MNERDTTCVVGVDFGATLLKGAVVTLDGRSLAQRQVPTHLHDGVDAVIGRIGALACELRDEAERAGVRTLGVGVGVCGLVHQTARTLRMSTVLPGWRDARIGDAVEQRVGVPVAIDNDANCAILGEWWAGAARGAEVAAGLTLGTGIGGGVVIGGRVFRGATGLAGEFGHLRVTDRPVPCACGGTGCLGRVASATALLARYHELRGEPDAVRCDSVLALSERLAAGDRAAAEAVAEVARYIAVAAGDLVNCFNPSVFVLAGGMSRLGEVLLAPVREHVAHATYAALAESTRVVAAELGEYSGSFGAAALAIEHAGHPLRTLAAG